MIAPLVLAGLLSSCASNVDARTGAAIVEVESGGRPFAIHDNTTGRVYLPDTAEGAKALLVRLAGHNLDVGIAQLNSANFARFGTDAIAQLDPCTSLGFGARVLVEDYRREYPRSFGRTIFERRQVALRRAFSAYNSGSPTMATQYADRVVGATTSTLVVETTAIADGHGSGAPAPVRRPMARKSRTPLRVVHGPARAASAFAGTSSRIVGSAFAEGGR